MRERVGSSTRRCCDGVKSIHTQLLQEIMMKTFSVVKTWAIALIVLLGLAACAETAHQRSTGQYVDDSTLTARVKTALIGDEQVKARNIDVDTYKGVVSLSGFVESRGEAERAVTLAQKVDGVRSVKDDMHVRQ
jgi:osmotically-inducible protein OsmY